MRGSRKIEDKHDKGDEEEASSQAGKQGDDDRNCNGGGEQDKAIDPSVVEGVRKRLVSDVLVLGKAHQQVPNGGLWM